MLTNFISDAAKQIDQVAPRDCVPIVEEERPMIQRNVKVALQLSKPVDVDIYDRARQIYFRARRIHRSASTSIL